MLRVNAVKELPAFSRVGEVGEWDREGPLGDRRVADGSGSKCSRVAVGLEGGHAGPNSIKVPESACGGSLVLMESRHVRERRLRPQAGCLVQLPV